MDVTSKVLLGLDAAQFRRGIQQVDAKLKETSKLFQNLGGIIGASFAVSQIQAFTSEAIQLGSQMQTVGKGFARFGSEMDLENLRKSTRGLVTDLELMKAVVTAGNFGIPIEKMGTLLEFAKRRAQETGQSVDYLVQSIVTGIGRKSPLILDNLGISTTRLKEKFHGAALEAQSIADVAQAVGDIATEELGKMGTAVDTAADKMVRLSTTWSNFKASFGEAIAPAASGFLEGLTSLLETPGRMGGSLNKLGVKVGASNPSDLIKPQGTGQGASAPIVEAQRTIVTLESLREKLKELEAQYASTEIGTAAFRALRKAIEDANYQLGRAAGEIWNGAKQTLIELDAKGIKPVTNSLVSQDMVLASSIIPAYDEWGRMIQGAKAQLELLSKQLDAATAFGAMFGSVLTGAFDSAMVRGTSFFEEIGKAIQNFVQQLAVALATTAALAVLFSAITGTPLGVSFKGISKATGLGGFFGEDGMFNMKATVSGSDLLLGTDRAGTNFGRIGG